VVVETGEGMVGQVGILPNWVPQDLRVARKVACHTQGIQDLLENLLVHPVLVQIRLCRSPGVAVHKAGTDYTEDAD
jgi:hypothetical protein